MLICIPIPYPRSFLRLRSTEEGRGMSRGVHHSSRVLVVFDYQYGCLRLQPRYSAGRHHSTPVISLRTHHAGSLCARQTFQRLVSSLPLLVHLLAHMYVMAIWLYKRPTTRVSSQSLPTFCSLSLWSSGP